MAFATWPATLPGPESDRQQQMEAGVRDGDRDYDPESARAYPEHNEQLSMLLDATQMAAWRTFVSTTLYGGGADWLPSLGYDDHVARIVMPWNLAIEGAYWRIGFQIEVISLEAA